MTQEKIKIKKAPKNQPQPKVEQQPKQESKPPQSPTQTNEPPQSESQSQKTGETTSSGSDEQLNLPTHFDSLINENVGEDGIEYDERQLTRDEFTLGLCGSMQAAGHFTGLRTLQAVSSSEQRNVDGCHALYDTIQDIPVLHFLLSPGGKWFGRVMAIGAFTVPIVMGVKAEIAAKQELAQQKEEKAEK